MRAATWLHSSHGFFLGSGMPITVQHFVHEPHDLPGAMAGLEAAFHSSSRCAAAGTPVPARSARLRFASPILMIPTIAVSIEPLHRAGTETFGRCPVRLAAPPQPGPV